MPIKPGTLTARGRETRERILDAAATLVFENGVATTTIEDVRAAAGVSNSQIYRHFPDKTALVRAVIDHRADNVIAVQEPLFAALDTLDGLRTWRDYAVEQQRSLGCRGGCPIGSLAGQIAEHDEAARLQLDATFRRWSAGLTAGLQTMHRNGLLKESADPAALAWHCSPPYRAGS